MFDFLFRKKPQVAKLPYTTDIHAHIIPGVDDGAQDIDQSIALCEQLVEWGVTRVFATPHRTDETFENSVETIEPAYQKLIEALKEKQIPLEVDYSFEYRLDEGFIELSKQGAIRALPNDFILVENSFIQPLWNLDEVLFQLKLKGYKPILAHPERYSYYHHQKSVYEQLHNANCYFQVNILSLAGHYGKSVQQIALWMLEKGYVDFVGTDLHHQGHVQAIDNFLKSKQYTKLKEKLSLMNDTL